VVELALGQPRVDLTGGENDTNPPVGRGGIQPPTVCTSTLQGCYKTEEIKFKCVEQFYLLF